MTSSSTAHRRLFGAYVFSVFISVILVSKMPLFMKKRIQSMCLIVGEECFWPELMCSLSCLFLRFFVEVSCSRDQRLVTINCSSKISSEVWFVDSKTPLSIPTLIQSRQPGLLYHVEHSDNYLFVLANTGANQEYQVRVSVSDLSRIVQN